MKPEYILCSAVNHNGTIVCGRRHKDCHNIIENLVGINNADCNREQQGFLTSLNRFVDRKEALIIAKTNKQLVHKMFDDDTDLNRELTSEDLFGVDEL